MRIMSNLEICHYHCDTAKIALAVGDDDIVIIAAGRALEAAYRHAAELAALVEDEANNRDRHEAF